MTTGNKSDLQVIDSKFKELTSTNFFEEINKELAHKFLNLKWRKLNKIDIEPKKLAYFRKYLQLFGSGNTTTVTYDYSKKLKDTGRIYPTIQGLTLLPKIIRNPLISGLYVDLDIKNAHPTFLLNISKLYNFDLPNIKYYVENRNDVINLLMKDLKKNKDDVKEIICSLLNGSLNTYNHDFLSKIRMESLDVFDNLHNMYPIIHQTSKKVNVTGSFVSILCQTVESCIMRIIVHFLKTKDIEVGTIIHDGCLVKKKDVDLENILKECNQFVKDNYYGFEIELVQKDILTTNYEDIEETEATITDKRLSELFYEYSIQKQQHYIFFDSKWFYSNEDTGVLWKESSIKYLNEQLTGEAFIDFCKESLEDGCVFNFNKRLESVKGSENALHFLKLKFLQDKSFAFNTNKSLLSFKNGVFDLQNNIFRKHLASDYLTICVDRDFVRTNSYDEQLAFISSLFEDIDTRDYVLKILATCIIGKRVFEEFFVFSGSGSNGKSTLINIIKKSLGPYSSEIDPNFFCEKPQSSASPNPEMHDSRYSRGLYMAEPEENSTFNSSKIKQYTGKSIKTRTIFEKPVEWDILFTIIFSCNNLPKFDDHTPAFKRRVRLVQFPYIFKEAEVCLRDNHKPKMYFEFDDTFYNGMVNLLIDYYYKYIKDCRNDNLVPIPQRVQEFTNTYFNDYDHLGTAISENFDISHNDMYSTSRKELYDHYSNNVEDVKYKVSPKRFYDYLRTNLDLLEGKNHGERYFKGIIPKTENNFEDDL